MTWQEFSVARALLMEESVGVMSRQARAAEDALFNRNRELVQKHARAQ